MKINFDKLNKNTDLGLTRPEAVLHYAESCIEYLYTHNKNYTRKQYNFICELYEIIKAIKE